MNALCASRLASSPASWNLSRYLSISEVQRSGAETDLKSNAGAGNLPGANCAVALLTQRLVRRIAARLIT